MATYKAISTGVASALARWEVWNGTAWVAASVLPQVGDDVYANGFTVTLDVDFYASSYRNGPLGIGVNANGTFILKAGVNIFGDIIPTAVRCITTNGAGNCFVVGNVYNGIGDRSAHGIQTETSNLTVIGDCISLGGASPNPSSDSYWLSFTSNAIFCNTGTALVIGDVYAIATSATVCVRSVTFKAVVVDGIAYGGPSLAMRACMGCEVRELRGNNENCIVTSKFVMPTTNQPVWVNCKAKTGANVQIEIYDELGNAVLCNPISAQGQASPADVRLGTSYANGALTGTCAIPPAASVALNVPVDNTVGSLATAAVVAADLLNEIASSSDPLAERLRNVATAQITAAQIAAIP